MVDFLHYTLTLLGVVYIVAQSYIFRPVRILLSKIHVSVAVLLYCPACLGFWVGLWLWKLGLYPFEVKLFVEPGIVGCVLGAIWTTYGPQTQTWQADQGISEDG